jgi:hypothetical protein
VTDEQIIEYCHDKNPDANKRDADAIRRMMVMFDCEDAATPQEAHERIIASMDSMSEEMENCSQEEQADILRRRIRWVP